MALTHSFAHWATPPRYCLSPVLSSAPTALSRKCFSLILAFLFLFPGSICFCCFLFCSRHPCWGSRPGRPQIPGLGGLLSLVDTSACRARSSLTAGSCPPGDGCGLESAAAQLRAGSPPLQVVEMTPLECQASPTSPQHTQGPTAHFFSPPVVSSCCCLVKKRGKTPRLHPVIRRQSFTSSSSKSGVRNEPKSRHRWGELSTPARFGQGRRRWSWSPRPFPSASRASVFPSEPSSPKQLTALRAEKLEEPEIFKERNHPQFCH